VNTAFGARAKGSYGLKKDVGQQYFNAGIK